MGKKALALLCFLVLLTAAGIWHLCFRSEPVGVEKTDPVTQSNTDKASSSNAPGLKKNPSWMEKRMVRIIGKVESENPPPSEEEASVEGFIFNFFDPVPGARVTLENSKKILQTIQTDDEGRFAFSGIQPRGQVTLSVQAKGFSDHRRTFKLTAKDAGKTLELEHVWIAPACRLAVQVTDIYGSLIDNAILQVIVDDKETCFAKPAGGGEYVFERLSIFTGSIKVKAPGYETAHFKVNVPSEETLKVQLYESSHISGVVTTSQGAPIPNAAIFIGKTHSFSIDQDTATDDTGRFRLDLSPGVYAVAVEAEGFFPAKTEAVTGLEEMRFRLLRRAEGVAIQGKVIAAATGEPIPEAYVAMTFSGTSMHPAYRNQIETGPDGLFQTNNLIPGHYHLSIRADDFMDHKEAMVIAKGMNPHMTIRLDQYSTISGHITDPSGQACDAKLRLMTKDDDNQIESENGEYCFSWVQAGDNYAIGAYTASGLWGWVEGIHVGKQEDLKNVNIHLKKGQAIRGRVINTIGDGVKSTIALKPIGTTENSIAEWIQDRISYKERETGADGRFQKWLFHPGRYELKAESAGRSASHIIEVKAIPDGMIEAIELVLPDGGSVSGRVINAEGKPLAGIEIQCWLSPFPTPDLMSILQTATDAQGIFKLAGIRCGYCILDLMDDQHKTKSFRHIPVPSEGLELIFDDSPKTARMTGQLRYGGMRTFPEGDIDVYAYPDSNSTDMAGRFSVETRTGQSLVKFDIPGFAPTTLVCTLRTGETRHIEVPLRRRSCIRGQVIMMGTGEPVPDANIIIDTPGVINNALWWPDDIETDHHGAFSKMDAAEGKTIITAVHPLGLGRSKPVMLNPCQVTEVIITLEPTTGIFGTLSDESSITGSQPLLLFNKAGKLHGETTTHPEGHFQFTGIPAGQYNIILVDPVYTTKTPLLQNVFVENGKMTQVRINTDFWNP